MCKEVQLKIHGARWSAQILKSDGPSEMQLPWSVTGEQPTSQGPQHQRMSTDHCQPQNSSQETEATITLI